VTLRIVLTGDSARTRQRCTDADLFDARRRHRSCCGRRVLVVTERCHELVPLRIAHLRHGFALRRAAPRAPARAEDQQAQSRERECSVASSGRDAPIRTARMHCRGGMVLLRQAVPNALVQRRALQGCVQTVLHRLRCTTCRT
jgi:hypothetical protein